MEVSPITHNLVDLDINRNTEIVKTYKEREKTYKEREKTYKERGKTYKERK